MDEWYTGQVKVGEQIGRTLGFPTINLLPSILSLTTKPGIYASIVKIHDKVYKGALFYGPRLVKNETLPALEIYILDFDGYLYGTVISFQLKDFIRENIHFTSLEDLKLQMKEDIREVDKIITL